MILLKTRRVFYPYTTLTVLQQDTSYVIENDTLEVVKSLLGDNRVKVELVDKVVATKIPFREGVFSCSVLYKESPMKLSIFSWLWETVERVCYRLFQSEDNFYLVDRIYLSHSTDKGCLNLVVEFRNSPGRLVFQFSIANGCICLIGLGTFSMMISSNYSLSDLSSSDVVDLTGCVDELLEYCSEMYGMGVPLEGLYIVKWIGEGCTKPMVGLSRYTSYNYELDNGVILEPYHETEDEYVLRVFI